MILTINKPAFVVQKFISIAHLGQMLYYASYEADKMYSEKPEDAFVFSSLKNASRIAIAEKAEIRVLFTPEEAKLFGVDNDTNN